MSRHRKSALALAFALTVTAAAAQDQRAQDWAWCANAAGAFTIDRVIDGCSAVIQQGQEDGDRLASAYFNRANAYRAKGQPDRAIEDYDDSIRLDPDRAAAFNNRGSARRGRGEFERAIADYDQAIRLDPTYASAFNNRALAWRAAGDYARALDDYDRAIELDATAADSFNNRGNVYASQGRYDRAVRDYDQALRLDPDYAQALNNRGSANFLLARFRAAAADLGRAFELGRTDVSVALWQHVALLRDGRGGESRLRDQTAALDPAQWPAPVVRLFLRSATPAQVLAAAHEGDPAGEPGRLCEAYFYLGQAALVRGDQGEALGLLRASVDTGVTDFLEYKAARAELVRLAQ